MTDEFDDSKAGKAAQVLINMVNKVVREGVGPLTGSAALAEDRLRRVQGDRYKPADGDVRHDAPVADVDKVISRLIKESAAAAGSAGFVTGLGGFVTLPIALPANVAGALIINVRLAGAIAYLRGYRLDDPHTQAMISLVALGSSAQGALAKIGEQIGIKLTEQTIKKISVDVLRKINRKVGFMLLAKYGTKRAVITLAKAVPLVGGLVGGTVDAALTGAVGRAASKLFS